MMTRTEALDFGTRASLKSSCAGSSVPVSWHREVVAPAGRWWGSQGHCLLWGSKRSHGILLSSQERGLTLNCSLASMSSCGLVLLQMLLGGNSSATSHVIDVAKGNPTRVSTMLAQLQASKTESWRRPVCELLSLRYFVIAMESRLVCPGSQWGYRNRRVFPLPLRFSSRLLGQES